MSTPDRDELPLIGAGSRIGEEYTLVAPLDEGGMGAVWVAEQRSTGKRRAVKLMHREIVADPSLRRRFEQEARAAAHIRSEHVVEVLAAGVDEPTGLPYLVMELLDGQDLRDRIAEAGALPHDEVCAIFEQLCHAMAAAHQAGVVHRDLKPENVFLARSLRAGGAPFTVKVLDFGIAKIEAEAGTRAAKTKGAIGSPLWMAPEQTSPGPVTPAADVWALGLVAYEALTGTVFWRAATADGGTTAQLLREIVLDPIPAATERARAQLLEDLLPARFDPWFARCLERDPSLRFADAGAAWRAMREVFGARRVRDDLAETFLAPVAGEARPSALVPSDTGLATPFSVDDGDTTATGAPPPDRSAPGKPAAEASGVRGVAHDDAPTSRGPASGGPRSHGPKSSGPKLPSETPLASVNETAPPSRPVARPRTPLVVGALIAIAGVAAGLALARRGDGTREDAARSAPPASVSPAPAAFAEAPPALSVAPPASPASLAPSAPPAVALPAAALPALPARPALAPSAGVAAAPSAADRGVTSLSRTAASASAPSKRPLPGGFSDPTDRNGPVLWKVQDRHVRLFTRLVSNDSNVADPVVRNAIEWSSWEYLRCYERLLAGAKDLPEGTVVVGFDILNQLPRHAALVSSTIESPAFNDCVVRTLIGQTINAAGPDGRGHVVHAFRFVPN